MCLYKYATYMRSVLLPKGCKNDTAGKTFVDMNRLGQSVRVNETNHVFETFILLKGIWLILISCANANFDISIILTAVRYFYSAGPVPKM